MLVRVLSFGTNWWARFGREPGDPRRFGQNAVYYNSTGVRCGRKIRRHWLVSGLIRFNSTSDFNPHLPDRSIGQTFTCSGLTSFMGGNRLLFEKRASKPENPDCYLIAISSRQYGSLNFASPVWKSLLSPAIAVSQLRDMQEAMLLMKPGDWIQTSAGFWQLTITNQRTGQARLEVVGCPVHV